MNSYSNSPLLIRSFQMTQFESYFFSSVNDTEDTEVKQKSVRWKWRGIVQRVIINWLVSSWRQWTPFHLANFVTNYSPSFIRIWQPTSSWYYELFWWGTRDNEVKVRSQQVRRFYFVKSREQEIRIPSWISLLLRVRNNRIVDTQIKLKNDTLCWLPTV